ncbi:MAG: hypothetical protein NW207_03050 [Cytophagales bacterium]|nr:hypothetical protein [Cytophagales bacterium]
MFALNNIENKIEQWYSSKNWKFIATVHAFLLACLFSFPRIPDLLNTSACCQNESYWHIYDMQKNAPFDKNIFKDASPESHHSNMALRIGVPILGKIFHLNRAFVLALQYLLGMVLFYCVVHFSYENINNKFISICFIFSTALIYAGKMAFVQTGGYFDTFAIVPLLAAMMINKHWGYFIGVIFSSFCDERAVVSIGFIALYLLFHKNKERYYHIISIAVGGITYIILRYYITTAYGLVTPAVSQAYGLAISTLYKNKTHYLTEIFKNFEGLWVLMIASYYCLFVNHKYIILILISGWYLITCVVSFMVWDMDRSLAYSIPLLFIAIYHIKQYVDIQGIKIIAAISLLFCFLFPTNPIMGAYNKYGNSNWFVIEFARYVYELYTAGKL